MEKVIKDGNVAVLYSPRFGAGWYSWNTENKEILYHPKLVEMVEKNKQSEITEEWMNENLGISDICCGGASDLKIKWMPQGTAFEIDEYDGWESIRTLVHLNLIA